MKNSIITSFAIYFVCYDEFMKFLLLLFIDIFNVIMKFLGITNALTSLFAKIYWFSTDDDSWLRVESSSWEKEKIKKIK